MSVLSLNSIADTSIARILGSRTDQTSKSISAYLASLYEEASARMKQMAHSSPQYTLHDSVHLLRVTELMYKIAPRSVEGMNSVELFLLALSALYHDQGMVLESEELQQLASDDDFKQYCEAWRLEHPNYYELCETLNDDYLTTEEKASIAGKIEQLDSAMRTDYIRMNHGQRSADFVNRVLGSDKRLEIHNVNLSFLLANLCLSHCLPVSSLTPGHHFRSNELVGTESINIIFLAVLLRIADVLDFDTDRTPESLYRAIHFSNDISVKEWVKHRSVLGWHISAEEICYSMAFEHPIYEKCARDFLDSIENEIVGCFNHMRLHGADGDAYRLEIPTVVNRSQIRARDNSYIYHDLEFSLSRDEIIKLLMTNNLYSHPSLCIRELLQNSIDALRLRQALSLAHGSGWDVGEVKFVHGIDGAGFQYLTCQDNGVGMDEDILINYFAKVGRSYYRSPEFMRLNVLLGSKDCGISPISRFGIGFMSCFMFGDRIEIRTRKDYGPDKGHGTPLEVEINGLSGIICIREGQKDQEIGTTIQITSREKLGFIDRWCDKVNLCRVLYGFALAPDFPIKATCTIPEISGEVVIPASVEPPRTFLEMLGIESIVTFQTDFREIHPRLRGYARQSFLENSAGVPALSNSDASWIKEKRGPAEEWVLRVSSGTAADDRHREDGVPVCADGILIAGLPGRGGTESPVMLGLGWRNSMMYASSRVVVDTRGEMKPTITPAREMPSTHSLGLPDGSWKRIQEMVNRADGLIWRSVLQATSRGLTYEDLWKLAGVYHGRFYWIPPELLWEQMAVSLVSEVTQRWSKISELGVCRLVGGKDDSRLETHNGEMIGPTDELVEWLTTGKGTPDIRRQMYLLAMLMGNLQVRDDQLFITPSIADVRDRILGERVLSSEMGLQSLVLPFAGNLNSVISVECGEPVVNLNHPLVRIYLDSRQDDKMDPLGRFASSFVPCIANHLLDNKLDVNKPTRWMAYCGHEYRKVSWDQYDQVLRAPYRIWRQGGRIEIVDAETIAGWKMPIEDE